MGKDVCRSIRLSQESFDYIESQPGTSFNNKLDNLITLMNSAIPMKLAELRSVDIRIEKQRKELSQLSAKIDRLRRLLADCEYSLNSLDRVLTSIERQFPASD